MGHVISAACICGYSVAELPIGGGRLDFTTNCAHPALCKTGHHVVTVNLKDSVLSCADGCLGSPLPYFSTADLQITPGHGLISDWQGRELNDGGYLCPKCEQYLLRFASPHLYFD